MAAFPVTRGLWVWFGFILITLGKTLTNGQSSCPDLFIKAPFLYYGSAVNVAMGGGGRRQAAAIQLSSLGYSILAFEEKI